MKTGVKEITFETHLSFHLKPVAPFRLDLTIWALRRRANNIVDRWDGKTYRRMIPLDGQAVDIAVTQIGPQDDPELNIEAASAGLSPKDESTIAAIVERMLGTRQDLLEFYHLASEDIQLSELAERYRGLKPPRFPTLFEAVINGIACQQISLTLGIILLNRLATNFGRSIQAEALSIYAFPQPEDLAGLKPQDIRRLGLSYNKANAIIELARMITERHLDLEDLESLDDGTVLSRLCQLRGVGRWTAEYVMLRGLGRIHIFPGDDVGARKSLQRWLKLKEPMDYEDVRRVLSRWKPYTGFLYFHLLLERLALDGIYGKE
jgi:DNA-3-methyladenine glycosylase II